MKWTRILANGLCGVTFFSTLFLTQKAEAQVSLLTENFTGFPSSNPALPYGGWTNNVISGDTNFDKWLFNNAGGRLAFFPISAPFACFDSDYWSNNGMAENVALESPSFSTLGYKSVI